MKEFTVVYDVTIDGVKYRHTETREAQNLRDAMAQILYAWYGADNLEFIEED